MVPVVRWFRDITGTKGSANRQVSSPKREHSYAQVRGLRLEKIAEEASATGVVM
jgi:hypothetical protein